jgi:hypothetical protein
VSAKKDEASRAAAEYVSGGTSRVLASPGRGAFAMMMTAGLDIAECGFRIADFDLRIRGAARNVFNPHSAIRIPQSVEGSMARR